MASAVSTEKLFANMKIEAIAQTADSSTALASTYVDLRDYAAFAVLCMTTVKGGNGLVKLEIVASDASDGSTNVTVIKDSGTVAADAVGDYVALECTAEEIMQLGRAAGVALRYVAARVTNHHAGDDTALTYIRHGARFPQTGLTASYISA
jgi:hypothetical protein